MTSILYIGMDVHTTNYTVSAYSIEYDESFCTTVMEPNIKYSEKYLERLNKQLGGECKFVCGYEAGYLGYSLYRQLTERGIECKILAPTTMPMAPNGKKNDRRDSRAIAKCMTYGTCSYVHVPTEEDDSVKEYIRMRDSVKDALKRLKQEITAFCVRHNKHYGEKSSWTLTHLRWLRNLTFSNALLSETLEEMLAMYETYSEKIKSLDTRITELSEGEAYKEKVGKLGCLKGISTHTALALIAEISDFNRFPTAERFAAYLGLVPGEHSSGDKIRHTHITKAGNIHLRTLLTEAANSYSKGKLGQKSKSLRARQKGNSAEVIRYADKASDRLRRKYCRMISRNVKSNVAKTAIARELACFVWGLMTDHISAQGA